MSSRRHFLRSSGVALASLGMAPELFARRAGAPTGKIARAKTYTLHGEPLASSFSSMMEPIALEEEYPWGITMERTADNVVQNKAPFSGKWCGYNLGNNFCNYGKGLTRDGEHALYFMGCMNPQGSPLGWAICLDGVWHSVGGSLPLRYDDGDKYPFPTVYTDPSPTRGRYICSTSYDERGRRWIWQCRSTDDSVALVAQMRARGSPLRCGKATGPYIMFGAASPTTRETFNVWGGFFDFCDFDAELKHPDVGELTFKGLAVKDREYHRGLGPAPASPCVGVGGYSYTAFTVQEEDFDLAIYECLDPWTGDVWCRQGRINLVSRGLSFVFDDYTYSDKGGLTPTEFKIKGKYARGVVEITGVATEGLKRYSVRKVEGIPSTSFLWPFARCEGRITIGREAIKVSTIGLAELTRMQVA